MALNVRVVLATCMLFISFSICVHSKTLEENVGNDDIAQGGYRKKRVQPQIPPLNPGVDQQYQQQEQRQQYQPQQQQQPQPPVLRYQQQQPNLPQQQGGEAFQPLAGVPKYQQVPQRGYNAPQQDVAAQQQLDGNIRVPGAKKSILKKLSGNKQLRIADHPDCHDDVLTLCGKNAKGNNFAVLDCLQNDRADNSEISNKCHNFLWQYKLNLTKDIRFESAASEVCKDALKQFSDCTTLEKGNGEILPCLFEHLENVTAPQCLQYLKRMMAITFSDYRLIKGFFESCKNDIGLTKCGDVSPAVPDKKKLPPPHSQGAVIDCLENHSSQLDATCKKQVLRVAELAANDYHLDRALYFACRDDRERFCENVNAGQGKVYKCLMKHKFEKELSEDCRQKLTKKQKLTASDYKINVNIHRKCKAEIKQFQCDAKKPKDRNIKLSVILLCLEVNVRQGKKISGDCQGEIFDTRKQLMEDYKISPRIILACRQDIDEKCDGLQRQGKTLHCLMKLTKEDKLTNPRCKVALKQLVEETNPGQDIRIDSVLQKACKPVEDAVCKDITKGNAQILSCLMDNLNSPEMTKECETRLLTLQYFITRDFKLDAQLYKVCREDAKQLCYVEDWRPNDDKASEDEKGDAEDGVVFNCLHNHLHPSAETETAMLAPACRTQMHRALRQRAISVHLNPNIERQCRLDLAAFCVNKNEKGEEMACLQENLDNLNSDCKTLVGKFITEESEDIKMNKILMKACAPMLSKFCKEHIKQQLDEGNLMQCLIEHKNDDEMDEKCAAGIEHFQLLELKDFKFTFKFKEACRQDVVTQCPGIKDKSQVISCLSGIARDDILNEHKHRLSDACRKQLKFEQIQKAENIKLDPELNKACTADIHSLCSKVKEGNARIIECLRENQNKLSDSCHMKIFNKQKKEALNPELDHTFMHVCKRMIKQFCQGTSPQEIFKCLKLKKNDPSMDSKCKAVLTKRQISRSHDFRLNPILMKSCDKDIKKFCKDILESSPKDSELKGKVIGCLKTQHAKQRLSRSCDETILGIMQDAAIDYRMDPVLAKDCRETAKTLCGEELDDPGSSRVEECLKTKLKHGRITDKKCQVQVIRLLKEGHADVNVDPLLHKACALDIKHYCVNIPQGEGRQMSCLLEALGDKTVRLTPECNRMLMERKEMWEYAAENAPPDTVQELLMSIHSSPSRNYFFSIFVIFIGCLFLFGMFCGRVTKHVRAEVKNK